MYVCVGEQCLRTEKSNSWGVSVLLTVYTRRSKEMSAVLPPRDVCLEDGSVVRRTQSGGLGEGT